MTNMTNMTKKRLFLVDAMAMAFRNYHAFSQRQLQTSTGEHTSAVYGSAQFMLKLLHDEKPDYVVVASDSKEKTFRHEKYEAYKANRKDMPEDLASQLPSFYELFTHLSIPMIKISGFEADDIIGTLVKRFASSDTHCYIVSGDKDFMQLVSENCSLYAPKKADAPALISYEGVKEKFGCRPDQVIDVLALIGDASDNVPGVRGIGDKGAGQLISDYGSLEGIYKNIDQIKNERMKNALISCKEMAYLSRELVTIKTDIDLGVSLDGFKIDLQKSAANQGLLDFFVKLEFRTLATKVKSTLLHGAPSGSNAANQHVRPDSEIKGVNKEIEINSEVTSKSEEESFPKQYSCANTPELFAQCLMSLNQTNVFSFDTETTGLDILESRPIGISFSTEKGRAWYVPLLQHQLEGWLTPVKILDAFRPLFLSQSKLKIAHNLKFDLQMLWNMGLEVTGPFGDTMLESYVLQPQSREHGLDFCSLEALKYKKISTKSLMGKDFSVSMKDVPLPELSEYACEDADITLRLHKHYESKLREQDLFKVYEDIEMPLVPVIAKMERVGIFLDADELSVISEKLDIQIKSLEKRIFVEAGEEFNIQSPKQLQLILFEKLQIHTKLGITKLKKTKSGFSTDASVLDLLSDHPLPKMLLEYRAVTKLKSTYVDALPQLIHPKSNRIHTSFHQTGTATGRLSSSDPNLQNIPIRSAQGREIRKAFKAKDSDHVLISADYSQVELRILAHIADDQGLKAAFASDSDIHTTTAMKIFGVSEADVTSELRSNAKAINFGIIYGMGPQRLARQTGVSMVEAKSFIEKYFLGFPKIRDFISQAKSSAKEKGYSITMMGRRRPIPELFSKDRMLQVNGENMAVNSPIQGSAADLIKIAMIELQKKLTELKSPARILLQVHDELVVECPKSIAAETSDLVKDAMENAVKLSVPLKVDVGFGADWMME